MKQPQKKNYFYNNVLIQKEGLTMGAPSSSLIAVFFLQHIEHQHMARLSMTHKIITYFRCVDDILIIFYPNHSSIQTILAEFDTLHQKLQFAAEMEENETINYRDTTIHRTPSNWKTAIYRKPTFTDTIIPYTSNHPSQHKYAAAKFLYNKLHTYNLQPDEYLEKENTIHNILYNNSFPIQPHKPHHPKPQKQRQTTHTHTHTHTHTNTKMGHVCLHWKRTHLCRSTNIKIAFRTNNTVYNRLTHKHHKTDKYTKSGVFKFICSDCKKTYEYASQTGRGIFSPVQ